MSASSSSDIPTPLAHADEPKSLTEIIESSMTEKGAKEKKIKKGDPEEGSGEEKEIWKELVRMRFQTGSRLSQAYQIERA
ncbi:hypothetical protein TNCV_698301 [Trichonephila clavipes]|nr:hypothetical protein TNCV_698301 [Trichonephila clavipes]